MNVREAMNGNCDIPFTSPDQDQLRQNTLPFLSFTNGKIKRSVALGVSERVSSDPSTLQVDHKRILSVLKKEMHSGIGWVELVCGLGHLTRAMLLSTALGYGVPAAHASPLADLPVLASKSGVLDILMVARAAQAATLAPFNPQAWVYDICRRPAGGAMQCPPTFDNLYGGTRLQLWPGDTLKIRLVNALPRVPDSKHASDSGDAFLTLNPINVHTHGMLVSPRYPTVAQPTYGDNVFVLTLNPANGAPSADSHVHGDMRLGYTDYSIKIPDDHPSGMYWFHPHVHGIALNQISAGLSGMITVGNVQDYVCRGRDCEPIAATLPVRHILLKDAQVLANGQMQTQEDPAFCTASPVGQGSCVGTQPGEEGGRWYFTLNGQPYPQIDVKHPAGEIWRLTAASGSVTQDIRLQTTSHPGYDLVFQVLSIDGVAVQGPKQDSLLSWMNLNSRRGHLVSCPGAATELAVRGSADPGAPVCATGIVMMPSSRVELWVAYRDAAGHLISPPPGAKAILRTVGYSTGPVGNNWPAVDLAEVSFHGHRSAGLPAALTIAGRRNALLDENLLAAGLSNVNAAVGVQLHCKPLAPGHGRRVFFGNPQASNFGLGYEEIDAKDQTVPGTFVDLTPFSPDVPTICVPLSKGNTPTTERWELVNLTGEDHNFHIHQVRFRVLNDPGNDANSISPRSLDGSAIAYDNLPLKHGNNACLTVQAWRDARDPASASYKACDGEPVTVSIPFSIAGDFVYHCHISEHQDGGMMARIRVRPSPN